MIQLDSNYYFLKSNPTEVWWEYIHTCQNSSKISNVSAFKFLEVHIVLVQLFQDLDNSAQNFYFNKSYSSFPRDITFNLIKFSTCTFILIKSSTTCKCPLYGPQVWTDGSLDKSSAQDMRIWVVDTYMGVKSVVLMTKTTDLHNGVQHWLAWLNFFLYISVT